MLFKKKLTIPADNATREIDVVQLWEVRWDARIGHFVSDTRPVVEVFYSKEEAEEFAESLRKAFALVRNIPEACSIRINKAK